MVKHRKKPSRGARLRHWTGTGRYRPRRHKDRRFPISGGVGLGTLALGHSKDWLSPVQYVQAGQPLDAGYAAIRNLVGYDLKYGTWDIWASLNPFDLTEAPAWKAALWSALVLKGVKRFTGDIFNRIPVVGKYVKMS